MDLGECPKTHSEALRADFEEANKKKNYGFEREALAILDDFLRTCDRKVEAAKKRLEDQELDPESEARANKVHDIAQKIGQKLVKAEQLGNEGEVEESVALLTEIEKLKTEKRQAEEDYRNNLPQPQLQQQKLRVCEVCAAYLCLYDNDRSIGTKRVNTGLGVDISLKKCPPGMNLEAHCLAVGNAVVGASKSQKTAQVLADHFGGKLHMGFIQIREKRNVLKKLVDDKSLQEEGVMDRETFSVKTAEYSSRGAPTNNYRGGRGRRNDYYNATYRRQRSRSPRRRSRSPRHNRRSRSRDRYNRSRSRDDRRSRRSRDRYSRSPPRRSRDRRRSYSTSSSSSGSSSSRSSPSRSRTRSPDTRKRSRDSRTRSRDSRSRSRDSRSRSRKRSRSSSSSGSSRSSRSNRSRSKRQSRSRSPIKYSRPRSRSYSGPRGYQFPRSP